MYEPSPLFPDKYYHVYNHGVHKNNIFQRDENYLFFLQKYKEHIEPVIDTFAFCLLPNHFHFAVRVKSEVEILNQTGFKNLSGLELPKFVSQQFSNFFNSYSKSFNKQQDRKGTLFLKPFKRNLVDTDEYFRNMIHYIHYNPVHHAFVKDLRDWKYTSYESYFSEKATKLKREEVISWFGNKKEFFEFHKNEIDEKMIYELEYF